MQYGIQNGGIVMMEVDIKISMRTFYDNIETILLSKYKGEYNNWISGKLHQSTRIEDDLGITGDDADEFIYLVCKEFKISADNFTFGKYFGSENEWTDFITPLIRLFTKSKKIPLEKSQRHSLTLGDIEYCVLNGVLSDSVITDHILQS